MKQCRWKEGDVDPTMEHFQLRWMRDVEDEKDVSRLLALVGKLSDQEFVVEFVGPSDQASSRQIFAELHHQLDFYLVATGESNPWAYVQYHCTTAANLYSRVHWAFSAGESRECEVIGPVQASREQKARFESGILPREWARAHPKLFTEHDLSQALNQPRKHYFEWRAAIELSSAHGYRSLQKYEFPIAGRQKAADVARLLGRDVYAWMTKRQRRRAVQCPDLLAFRPDMSDAQFYEAKGPSDRLRKRQKEFFSKLSLVTGRPVKIVKFSWRVAGSEIP